MAYKALSVANTLLDKMGEATNIQLQKLMYFAHGEYLAKTGQPLVENGFQAWDLGPVNVDLYHEAKHFGRDAIKSPFDRWIPLIGVHAISGINDEDSVAHEVINNVVKNYGQMSPFELVTATHEKNSPWDQVYIKGEKGVQIPDSSIKEYFKEV